MKTSHIFWGTLFICIGLLVLVNNFTTIFLDWNTIWKLWPVVIILLGISLLIKYKFGKGLAAGTAAIILAVTVFAMFKTTFHFFNNDFEFVVGDGDAAYKVNEYFEPFDSTVAKAKFFFDAGAGSFILKDTTDKLFYAKTFGNDNNYLLSHTVNTVDEIKFSMRDTKVRFGKNYKNKVEMKLNPLPVWNLDFDIGAASLNLDLSQFKIENVDVDMGAASIDLRISALMEETNINIEAGASNIDIFIPEEAGCKVILDAALSSKNFDGFEKIDSDFYRTSNFENAKKKIYIKIDSGVSSISVRRY